MKKVLSFILAAAMGCMVFAGCSKEETVSYDVNAITSSISESINFGESRDVTEEDITIMVGLDMADVKSYAGKFASVNTSADQIIVIEAAEGKIDTVKQSLETYKEGYIASLSNYPESALQMEKAKAGRIVVKGNVAVLVIAGDDAVAESSGVEEAYKPVDSAIDEAFK